MQQRTVLWFLFAVVLVDMIGFGIVMPVLPELIMHLGDMPVDKAALWAGWLAAGYAAMQFVFAPIIGSLSDRFGRRPVLLACLAGFGIDYLVQGLAPSLGWLVAGRVVAGLTGASYSAAYAYIADVTPPEKRAASFGLMGMAFGFGFIIGPALGGLLGEIGPRLPFLAAAGLALVNVLAILALSGQLYGTATYPVTHRMVETVEGGFQVMLYIILTFYAGELVWRERAAGVAAVSDAFPTPDGVPLVAKLLALFTVVGVFLVTGSIVAIGWQLAHGHTHLEPGLYLAMLALDALPYLLLAALAVFFQVIANNRFLGYLLTIVWLVASLIGFGLLGWEHHLYNFGTAPATPYSDLNGFGHFLPGAQYGK